jgi:anti-sigma regulatory factor (Ser/Thr protein kinase)
MGNLLEAKLRSDRQAAGEARRLVARLGNKELGPVIDDVSLLVSELVTNCYRYGGLGQHDSISLKVSQEGKTVRVEITDPGRGKTVPTLRRPTAEGGWGLEIVRRTADRWGTRKDGSATVVWFELGLDRVTGHE